jgi:heme-degrading monooxygenase HmoA
MGEERFVWTTTRRIKPGTREEFEQAWQPQQHPEGMTQAWELWSDDDQEIVGISFWDSEASCRRYRSSDVEEQRRRKMKPYVVDERSSTYTGRELRIP